MAGVSPPPIEYSRSPHHDGAAKYWYDRPSTRIQVICSNIIMLLHPIKPPPRNDHPKPNTYAMQDEGRWIYAWSRPANDIISMSCCNSIDVRSLQMLVIRHIHSLHAASKCQGCTTKLNKWNATPLRQGCLSEGAVISCLGLGRGPDRLGPSPSPRPPASCCRLLLLPWAAPVLLLCPCPALAVREEGQQQDEGSEPTRQIKRGRSAV